MYKIVLAKGGVQKNSIDLPAGDASQNDGDVQKMFPNDSRFQQWIFTSDPDRPGRWKINCNLGQEKYLEVDGDDAGKSIRFAGRRNSAYQSWRLQGAGDNKYVFVNDGSGRCIDYKPADDKGIQQWENFGNEYQIWLLVKL